MYRKIVIGCFMSISFLLGSVANVDAEENQFDFFEFMQKAFNVQVSLSEKGRSISEIEQKMAPYFTESFIDQFIEENIVKTEEGYQTHGTDFALYYIPYFSYSDRTKMIEYKNQLYIIEKINEHEGPVKFSDSYQGVRLTKEKDWKIADVLWVVPEEIIQEAQSESNKRTQGQTNEMFESSLRSVVTIQNIFPVFWNYTNEAFLNQE
ncbi:DUF3993 domain-containing protein [Bacillus sp. SD088]|uniref:DUF3993 domain-containing protein n=1 Tax=Bacillus sp. SD088 TaxID=2782012 RepID=UPI001A9707ED|nr:DUF3993 domain-containing protein [Bacillus sp. SD088]MBO0994500.1 DUF3993 domain-containing protein [Bacillus sp. SD088]